MIYRLFLPVNSFNEILCGRRNLLSDLNLSNSENSSNRTDILSDEVVHIPFAFFRKVYSMEKKLKDNLSRLIRESPNRLTQAKLCKECGISPSVMSGWLRGVPPKGIGQLKVVADYFGLTLDSLIYGNAEIKTQEQSSVQLEEVGEFRVLVQRVKKGKS